MACQHLVCTVQLILLVWGTGVGFAVPLYVSNSFKIVFSEFVYDLVFVGVRWDPWEYFTPCEKI